MTALAQVNTLEKKHLLTTESFSKDDLSLILDVTGSMERSIAEKKKLKLLDDKILATLFFEPSTRTRLSFETAMLRLGGQVITIEQGEASSIAKGETLEDMGAVVSRYADIIAMRHPKAHSVEKFSTFSKVPVINAGDGPNQHPTQALLDLYTIFSEQGKLDGLTIGMIGDLKYGRTVHSLASILEHYKINFVFISPEELQMPRELVLRLKDKGCTVKETSRLDEVISDLDILYVTRVQVERFTDAKKYSGIIKYQLTKKALEKAKDNLDIMHPLPRVDEILPEIDYDPKAKYFKQVENGVYLRMALLSLILGRSNN